MYKVGEFHKFHFLAKVTFLRKELAVPSTPKLNCFSRPTHLFCILGSEQYFRGAHFWGFGIDIVTRRCTFSFSFFRLSAIYIYKLAHRVAKDNSRANYKVCLLSSKAETLDRN